MDHFINYKNQSVNIDIDGGEEVWTQPAQGYEFSQQNLRPLAAEPGYRFPVPGTMRLIDVSFNLSYINEAYSTRQPTFPTISRLTYDYTLELDRNDFIIGGEWRSEKRPDFMWQLHDLPHPRFQAGLDYQILHELLLISLRRRGESADVAE